MKIGLICPYNLFKGGGVQECVLALQAGLNQLGYKVKIITPLPFDHKTQTLKDVIFIGRAADVKSPFHTTAQLSVSLDTHAIDDVLKQEQFDILHFHEPWVPLVSLQILSRSHSKNIATFHAKLPESAMSKTIEKVITPYTRSVIKYLDSLTAVSEAAAEYVHSLTDKTVHIIPNGINLDDYRHKNTATNNTLLYIGRLERRKGVKYLLKAFALVADKDQAVRLIIAGDGPDRTKLEAYVKEKTIPRVEFRGFVSQPEKLKLLSHARLFVSPALFGESFGIVLLEAMAAGVPIVAGNNPGYSGVLRGTGELSIVNPKDTEEFARRLSVMLHDEALRGVWRNWASQYVKQFSYKQIVDKYEDLYKQLIK